MAVEEGVDVAGVGEGLKDLLFEVLHGEDLLEAGAGGGVFVAGGDHGAVVAFAFGVANWEEEDLALGFGAGGAEQEGGSGFVPAGEVVEVGFLEEAVAVVLFGAGRVGPEDGETLGEGGAELFAALGVFREWDRLGCGGERGQREKECSQHFQYHPRIGGIVTWLFPVGG